MKKHFSFFLLIALSLVIWLGTGGCADDPDTSSGGAETFEGAAITVLDTSSQEVEDEWEEHSNFSIAGKDSVKEAGTDQGASTDQIVSTELVPKSIPKPKPKPKQKPRLVVQNAVYDYGFIDEGDKISHTFTLINTGKANLIIEEVLPACGCTVAKLSVKKIKPGSSATLKVDFDSKDKFGKQNKVIEILSNAGYHKVKLVGVVYPKDFKKEEEEDAVESKGKPENAG